MSGKPRIPPTQKCECETEASRAAGQQYSKALLENRALTEMLMERVCNSTNLNQDYKRVVSNKGAAGVDGLSTTELLGWIKQHKLELVSSLLVGSYKPQKVRGLKIPKPYGGTRLLDIPTVVDRLVQHAILQVLNPILDPEFSNSSYGFRDFLGA